MFTFQWPLFALLLPLPLLIHRFWKVSKEVADPVAPTVRFPHIENLRSAFGSASSSKTNRNQWMLWLSSAAWFFLTLALMRPQIVNHVTQQKNEGHDLMLAVDLSGSMQSLDFSSRDEEVSRLDVAKKVVGDFLKKRSGDRVGLILFGEHAYLNSPLTLDTAAVSKMLNNSLSGMAGDATAIGDAVGLAVKTLRNRPAQSRAIILLTDGDDNASSIPPLEAAKLAQSYGIHIYTIVIGKEGVVPFPDGHGGTVMVESQINTELTRKMAEITGGEFYKATDQKALAKIYDRIDALEKSEVESRQIVIRKSLYQYPMTAALLLLAFAALFSQIRRESYAF